MYTIKEAAARSGVGAPAIRAWERRYGVVKPVRTAAGYRLYDDHAIRVLLAMRTLLGTGWTASAAAGALVAGEVDLDAIAPPGAAMPAPDPAAAADHRRRLVARFVAAAQSSSVQETEAVLDEMQASGSYEAIVDDLMLPAAAALGDAWADGRLSVAAEHAASAAIGRRLAAAFQAAGVPGPASVVVGLPPGSRHELGALAFAVAVQRRGIGVLYVGADVPIDGWLDAIRRTHARAAVIGVVTEGDRSPAGEVVSALLHAGVPLVAVGGAAANSPLAGGVVSLPGRVVDAATAVAAAVTRRR